MKGEEATPLTRTLILQGGKKLRMLKLAHAICVAVAVVAVVVSGREHASHDPEGLFPFHEHTLAHPYTRGGGMTIPYWHFQVGKGRGEEN